MLHMCSQGGEMRLSIFLKFQSQFPSFGLDSFSAFRGVVSELSAGQLSA